MLGRFLELLLCLGYVMDDEYRWEEPGINERQFQIGEYSLTAGWHYGEYYIVGPAELVEHVILALGGTGT